MAPSLTVLEVLGVGRVLVVVFVLVVFELLVALRQRVQAVGHLVDDQLRRVEEV